MPCPVSHPLTDLMQRPDSSLFLSLLNTLDEPFFLLDTSAKLVWYNKACDDLYRQVSNKSIDESFHINELLTAGQQGAFTGYLDKVLGGGRVEFEWKYQLSMDKWLGVCLYPFYAETGVLTGICGSVRDITEKKNDELTLQRNSAVLNNIQEAVLLLDGDLSILTFNRWATTLFERIDSEPLTGMNFLELLPEYRRGPAREHLETALAGGHVEYEVQYPDGNWIFVNYLPVKDVDGSIRQISVSFRDITEKKSLQSEMEILALLARETVNAVCILDPGGEMLWINEGFVRLTGYSREELIGGTSRVFLHGAETDPAVVERAAHCRQNGLPFTEEFRIYSKQGKRICTRVQGQAIRPIKGNIPSYFCIVTDITEEKKILEELEVLSMVAKETNNSVMIFDRFTRQVVWVNEGFTRLTGYTAEDIIGKDPTLLLSGSETDMELMKEWDVKIRNNQSYSGDMTVYIKDGQKKIHHVHSQPFRGQRTDRSWYFAVGSDITERRRLEEERLQAEVEQQQKITHVILETRELERNELGRELHDNINQLLAATHLQLSYSLKHFPNCKPVIEQCRQNILDAMGEIRQLSHKMVVPRFSEKDLPEVLKGLADNYSYAMRIKLETDTWNENSVCARVKEAFFRIAQEQLSNIYKHAQATQVKIIIVSDTSNAQLAVEDNGIGFDTTSKVEGIGLSNIRSRVEACNGVSEFRSAPGKGCSLLVRIPLDAA